MSNATFARKVVASFWLLALLPCTLLAMPSAPGGIVAYQPDGKPITVLLRGDEHQSWYETEAGYTVIKNAAGQWVYALPIATGLKAASSAGGLKASNLVVGFDENQLSNVTPHLRPGFNRDSTISISPNRAASVAGNPILPRTGDVPLLVILGYYDDTMASTACENCASTEPEALATAVFDADRKSVRHYYRAASLGKLNIIPSRERHGTSNDGVVGWLRLGATMPAATVSNTSLYKSNRVAADAINAAMAYVDFTAYDNNGDGILTSRELGIMVVVSGYEGSYGRNGNEQSLEDDTTSPRFWGQSRNFSSGSRVDIPVQHSEGRRVAINTRSNGMTYSILAELHGDHFATLGIMVHELGHSLFGLPDLYDVSGASSGVGVWSVMSYGSWGEAAEDREAGETPVLPDAWMRLSLGWIEPMLPTAGSLHSAFAAGDDQATVIKIPTAEPSEYFLVENRQHYGYDTGLTVLLGTTRFGGLAVWHIDDRVGSPGYNNDNALAAHKRVDLMAAVGDDFLDNGHSYGQAVNLFFETNNAKLDDTTKPNTHLYSGEASEFGMSDISDSSSPMTFVVNNSKAAVASVAANETTLSEVTPTATEAASSSAGGGGALDVFLLALSPLLTLRRLRENLTQRTPR